MTATLSIVLAPRREREHLSGGQSLSPLTSDSHLDAPSLNRVSMPFEPFESFEWKHLNPNALDSRGRLKIERSISLTSLLTVENYENYSICFLRLFRHNASGCTVGSSQPGAFAAFAATMVVCRQTGRRLINSHP